MLEAARRALERRLRGRDRAELRPPQARRRRVTVVLLCLVLATGVLVFVGGGLADDLLGFIGLGPTAAQIWSIVPLARGGYLVAMLRVLPSCTTSRRDVQQHSWRWVTPGAIGRRPALAPRVVGFSNYIESVDDVQGRLRRVRGRDRPARVDLAHQRDAAVRGRARRGDRAPEGAARRTSRSSRPLQDQGRRARAEPASRTGGCGPPHPGRGLPARPAGLAGLRRGPPGCDLCFRCPTTP